MFKWFREYFKAQTRLQDAVQLHQSALSIASRNTSPTNKCGNRRVEILEAVNGHVLEVAHRKTRNDDWEVTLYMVRDDESLADAIATALVVTGGI
jgi:hypothetical protein